MINYSFSKIFLILGNSLDINISISENTIFMVIITSTILSAIGKVLGIYSYRFNLKKLIPLLFLGSFISIFFCFFSNNLFAFIVFRNLQGFFSGLEFSICFGILGHLHKSKSEFFNFNFLSVFSSVLVGFCLYFFKIKYLVIILSYLCIKAAIVLYIQLKNAELPIQKPISSISENLKGVILNWKVFKFTLQSGFLLAIVLSMTIAQRTFLVNFSDKLKNFISVTPFLMAAVSPFFKQEKYYAAYLIVFLSGFLLCLVFSMKYSILFSLAIGFLFLVYSIFNAHENHEKVNLFRDKFTASAYIFAMRSFVNAFGLWSIKKICFLTNFSFWFKKILTF